MWWAEGIRFGCTACGRCCVRRVPAASAPLAESEIQSMAQALGLSSVCFKGKYTESLESANMKGRQLKVDPVSGRCMLLTESGKCSVHDARPAACRTYPFWPENVASPYEWAREAVLCEGIESTWAQPAPSEKRDEVPARSVEDELLVEELRVAGYLYQENWTHSEAMEYIEELREANMSELDLEPPPAPRKVLWHDNGLVVLETNHSEGNESAEQGDSSDVIRSLHFESSIGVVQTEVRYHPERGFDYCDLVFGVHVAFLQILQERAAILESVLHSQDCTVVVLGGGGGVLPMALQQMALRQRSERGPLGCIRRVISVEKDPAVSDLGKRFFGFREGGPDVDVKLHTEDALKFFDSPLWDPADSVGLAILVDIAGDVHRSSGGEVLAPHTDFLLGDFVKTAASAVSPHGVVAWNVLISELGEESFLQSTIKALHSSVPDDRFEVGYMPIRRSCGVAQWLLVGSWNAEDRKSVV